MNIYEKLLAIQNELKAPKSQFNKFGGYNYRNCEDILEAVKPLCAKHKALVFLTDDIVQNGDRYYVKATATFVDVESPETPILVTAYAREEETKKGMDGSQVTGASSSYARKYALNGLFDIDDTKDSDTTNTGNDNISNKQPATAKSNSAPSAKAKQSGKNSPLTDETKQQINNGLSQCKNLTGKAINEIMEDLNSLLGYAVKDIKTEEQGKAAVYFLLKMISDYEGKGA